MSDYSSLKATINANVKANNNHEITGSIMNSVLNAMVNSLGAGYQFIGVATPTNPGTAQTPDYKCFYLATTPGTYTNLGGFVVADGEVAILKYDTAWTKEVTGAATADQVSQLGQYVDNPEWVKVVTDGEGKILYGVKTDGKFYFGDGCPPQVQEYVLEQIDAIGINALLATKVDKVTGKSLIDADFASSQSAIENPEWIKVTTDIDGRILRGIKKDGSVVENCDVEYPNGIPNDIKTYVDEQISRINGSAYPVLKDKSIVCFGDSITMFKGSEDAKSYPMWMDELSDAEVIGCGFGGTRVSSRSTPTLTPSSIAQADAAFDLINLVNSICNNDYSYLDAGLQYIIDHDSEWVSTQYAEALGRVKSIDWSKVDYVTILIGTNDWAASASMGASGSTDTTTVLGAINKVIETLLLTYPHLKVYWFTPLLRYIIPAFSSSNSYSIGDICQYDNKYYEFVNSHLGNWNISDVVEITAYDARKPEFSSDVLEINGITLKEFSKTILDEVTLNHIPIDDFYNGFGWNRYNFSEYFIDRDSTHPFRGFKYIAEKVLGHLNGN